MSIKQIIMITGSKGGGGKTPVAASLAISLQQLNAPTVVCDFNFNNADLFSIFAGSNIEKRRQLRMRNGVILGKDEFYEIDHNFWLNRWSSTISVGLPSIDAMWEKINEICSYHFPSDKQPQYLVIDTNLTLPLICPSLPTIKDYPDLPPVQVFHLWSPAIVMQFEEQSRFEKTIDIMNRFSPGFELRLTHLFTPRHHQSTGFFGTLTSLTKGEFSVAKKLKLKQKRSQPIGFNEIKEIIFADFLPKLLNMDPHQPLDIQELTTSWFTNIISSLEDREVNTPNVLLVPTVVHDIAMLVEQLSLKPQRTVEMIRDDLGSLYLIIFGYMEDQLETKIRSPRVLPNFFEVSETPS